MYIGGMLAVGFESRDVYRWCDHCRRPLQDVRPGLYIVAAPTVEYESIDIYR